MSALVYFITWLLHHIEAVITSTYISESWFHTWRRLGQLCITVSTCSCLVLLTGFPEMVGLLITTSTEVLSALTASNSKRSHMSCSFIAQNVSLIIFLSFNNITWNHFHNITTLATHETIISLYNLHDLIFLDFFLLLGAKQRIQFKISNISIASRTLNRFIFRFTLHSLFF